VNGLLTIHAQHARVSILNLPLIQSYKPASFQERGVAVPFTTPRLSGARVRTAQRTGTEFVVPNPSGGRGVYVLHWGGVRQFCRPTVHDTLLHQRIARLPVMDPRGVRRTVHALAAEGMAGSEAAAAAVAAAAADRKERLLTNFLLLILLMEQIEPLGLRVNMETERTPELDLRARRIVSRFAASCGSEPDRVSADLEAISEIFVPIGLEAIAPPSRLPRLNARLDGTATTLGEWARRFPNETSAPLAVSLSRSAALTSACAAATLRDARSMAVNVPGLLRAWISTPAEVTVRTSRPEWVLDGWERFCLLWETASHVSEQCAVLLEMAQIVPVLPREATEWAGQERAELEALEPGLRNARLNEPWRAGAAAFSLIARNEHLQSLIE